MYQWADTNDGFYQLNYIPLVQQYQECAARMNALVNWHNETRELEN